MQEGYIGSGGEAAEAIVTDIVKLPPEFKKKNPNLITSFTLDSVDAEPIKTFGDEYNQRVKIDENENRTQQDSGDRTPSDVGNSSPGTPEMLENPWVQDEAEPGPDSPSTMADEIIPAQDGWGGEESGWSDSPEPGPGGKKTTPDSGPGSSEKQNALNDLPSADKSEFASCPALTIAWVRNINSTLPNEGHVVCGCNGPFPGSVCTASSSDIETLIFNCNSELAAYEAELKAAGDLAKGECGGDTIWDIRAIPGTDDCQDTGNCDGPIAYTNVSESGYGSGAWLDGSDSTTWYND